MIPEKFQNLPTGLLRAAVDFDNQEDFDEFCEWLSENKIPGWSKSSDDGLSIILMASSDIEMTLSDIIINEPSLKECSSILDSMLWLIGDLDSDPNNNEQRFSCEHLHYKRTLEFLCDLSKRLQHSHRFKDTYIQTFTCYNIIKFSPEFLSVNKVKEFLEDIRTSLEIHKEEIKKSTKNNLKP